MDWNPKTFLLAAIMGFIGWATANFGTWLDGTIRAPRDTTEIKLKVEKLEDRMMGVERELSGLAGEIRRYYGKTQK